MRRTIAISALAALTSFGVAGNSLSGEKAPPSVVELFTSQGCSSCPPADRLLVELAEREDVVAIAFHVNYWDYIGWKDPFATQWGTDRQSSYARSLGLGNRYTPQMLVDGKRNVVGSRRVEVANALVSSMRESDERIPLSLAREADEIVAHLPGRTLNRPLQIWLVRYSGPRETKVRRGENRGATLINTHIALQMELVGEWDGKAGERRMPLPLAGDREGGVAVWVQEKGPGAILGAASLDLVSGS